VPQESEEIVEPPNGESTVAGLDTLVVDDERLMHPHPPSFNTNLIAERDRDHSIEVVLSDHKAPVVVEPELAGHDNPVHQVDSAAWTRSDERVIVPPVGQSTHRADETAAAVSERGSVRASP